MAQVEAQSNPVLITRTAAARKVGISKWLLQRAIERREVACLCIAGRQRIEKEELEQYMQRVREAAIA